MVARSCCRGSRRIYAAVLGIARAVFDPQGDGIVGGFSVLGSGIGLIRQSVILKVFRYESEDYMF